MSLGVCVANSWGKIDTIHRPCLKCFLPVFPWRNAIRSCCLFVLVVCFCHASTSAMLLALVLEHAVIQKFRLAREVISGIRGNAPL